VVRVALTRFNINTSQRDTVGYGVKKLGPEADYIAFSVTINELSSLMPDTVSVKFESSENGFCNPQGNTTCLYFYIDDIELTDIETGIKESLSLLPKLKVFPNPANN
jgi:hypothetical protein